MVEEELTELQRAFLMAAYDEITYDESPASWNGLIKKLGIKEKSFGEILSLRDQEQTWFDNSRSDEIRLAYRAKAYVLKIKAAEAPIEFKSDKERHFFASAYPAARDIPARNQTFNYKDSLNAAGFSRKGGFNSEAELFIKALRMHGYGTFSVHGMCHFTDKGFETAKKFFEEAEKLNKPQPEVLTKRFASHQQEADWFLVWAWNQYRGDLNKTIDIRKYAVEERRLNKYEAMALVDWLEKQEQIKCRDEDEWVNLHAETYWDAPLNSSFPHGFFVAFTPKGSADAAKLAQYHHPQSKAKRAGAWLWTIAKDAKSMLLLGAIATGAFWLHGSCRASKPQGVPTSQPIPAQQKAPAIGGG